MLKCGHCGKKIGRKAYFCPECGKQITKISAGSKTKLQRPTLGLGAVFSIVMAVIVFIGIILPVVNHLITVGPEFGRWEENDILRDFNTILSGRKSEYQKLMGKMQLIGLVVAFVLCLPGYLLMSALDRQKLTKGWIFPGVICSSQLITCWFLLLLFDFVGTPRIIVLVLFFILALLWLTSMIFAGIKAKGFGVALMLLSLALGFLIAAYLAAFVGAGAVIFGDLFWIFFAFFALCGGGGGGYIIMVYVS